MTFYDIDRNCQLTLGQIEEDISKFVFFLKGAEREPQTRAQLSQMLDAEGISCDNDVVVVQRKIKEKAEKTPLIDIHQLIKLIKREHVFTEQQLEMFQKEPSLLFEKQMFRFKYGLYDGTQPMSQEREDQLVTSLLSGSDSWKEATLQEMQALTKKYLNILKASLKLK